MRISTHMGIGCFLYAGDFQDMVFSSTRADLLESATITRQPRLRGIAIILSSSRMVPVFGVSNRPGFPEFSVQ